MKLPTTFKTLDLTGFDFDRTQQYTGISRVMVEFACAVLQKNRVGIVVRSVNAALKEIYGIGGSTDVVCKLLKEWRADNLASMQGRSEKDLASALMETADDGLLEENEIPKEYLAVFRQMAIAGYRLAYQKADTSVSGDRMKSLAAENELMRQQLKDFPQLQMQLVFYQSEYDRQRNELKEAYMNLNKQQLVDSEQFRLQLENSQSDRGELQARLAVAEQRLAEVVELESASRDRLAEISRLNGQLEAREREISSLHSQVQVLQAVAGEKQVLEAQLEQIRSQFKAANETITHLQSQQKSIGALEVDVESSSIMLENETLHGDLSEAMYEIDQLKAKLAEFEVTLPVTETVAKAKKQKAETSSK
jgi:DNA repair exonuclease SbcCD ATPase subunit